MTIRHTLIETDMNVIRDNLRLLLTRLPEGVKFMAVVKADSYGHGAEYVLRDALTLGAWGGAVATPDEGIELREKGFACPLLVLGTPDEEGAYAAVRYSLSQACPDMASLKRMEEAAHTLGKKAIVHIKLDTGMGRIGIRTQEELLALLAELKAHPEVEVEGLFAHFAAADEYGDDAEAFTREQGRRFAAARELVLAQGFAPLCHTANSAAMLRYPEYSFDMVRIGVSMYGFSPFMDGMHYAQRWLTRAVFCKTVPAGTPVSYGATFVTKRETRILTLPVGYADGYPRALSNKADVLVCGRRARVIGRVCMDQIMIDVTDIPDADIGSEVVLMGAQGSERITPEELADLVGTIPYEIMLAPRNRVSRVITNA